ncbi:MAG TPA: glycosyltransferase family 4 protein [Pirellulaceae bacterium]|nr:glycosyltransferase family 4 protein [Pirellulaceae bacterium]
MSQLRIVMVTRRYWPQACDAEMMMANLAGELHRQGHQVVVLTAQWETTWPSEVLHRELPVIRLPQPKVRGWGTIRYMHSLSRWLRKHRHEYDAVIVSGLRHDAYATLTALRGSTIPVLLRCEAVGSAGDCAWQQTARFGSRIRGICLTADALIAPNATVVDELSRALYALDRIHIVAGGVSLPEPRTLQRQSAARASICEANMSLEVHPSAPVVVTTGRLQSGGGHLDLVYAWERVARREPNGRLWMIGDGPERDVIYDLMVDLGLHHQVFMPGAFDDHAELLDAADLYVQPTTEEGQSLGLLEAMAVGVPVIATDIASHRHLIEHNVHGWLVPPHDPVALQLAMERLLADRALTQRLGTNARQRVAQDFSLVRMARQHIELIERLIATHSK